MLSSNAPAVVPNPHAPGALLAFLYEHPQWFAALFVELKNRGVPFDKIFIPEHFYDISGPAPTFRVIFNRMSPSADSRQHGSGIFHALAYLAHLERLGTRVINRAKAFGYEISKASQTSLLRSLSLRFIPSLIIHAALWQRPTVCAIPSSSSQTSAAAARA